MKKKSLLVAITTILLLVIGVSFAYYVMYINFTGTGSEVSGITKEINDVTVTVEGKLDFSDTDILPGHKNISSIKLTATGDKTIYYNLIWNGTNTLSSALNYTIYRVDSEKEVSMSCTEKEQYLIGEIRFYEECTMSNESALGEVIATGTISRTNSISKTVLKKQESITATTNGTTTYYYVVLEFPNADEEQEQIENGAFSGEVTVEQALETATIPKDIILANMNEIRTETDFSNVATEETTGVIYKEVVDNTSAQTLSNTTTPKATLLSETEDNVTYYFRGAPKDNYVKFAGFYWRIIRINENGSIRMIYSGKVSEVDAAGKETVLANGYNDSSTNFTHIGVSVFNGNTNFEGVGLMYTVGQYNGNTSKSTILENILEPWYKTNIVDKELESYIDIESGFCGDRTYELIYSCDMGSATKEACEGVGGFWYPIYRFGASERLPNNNPTPTFGCLDSANDLYTISSSSKGNKALTYPIGLITADEVIFAGGDNNKSTNIYLYNGNYYWTMSPDAYDDDVGFSSVFIVDELGYLVNENVFSGMPIEGVRPVINLSSDVTLSGNGTIESPYEVLNS